MDLLVPRGCVLTCLVNYLTRTITPDHREALDFAGRRIQIRLVTRHLPLVTSFLTGTPKQLEIAASHTKQSSRPASNRDTNRGSPKARFEHFFVAPLASPVSGVRWTPPESRDRTCRRIWSPVTALNIPSNLPVRLPAVPSTRSSIFTFHFSLFDFHCFSNRDSKLLETSVNHTKQSTELRSNRDKIAGCSMAQLADPGHDPARHSPALRSPQRPNGSLFTRHLHGSPVTAPRDAHHSTPIPTGVYWMQLGGAK